MLNEAKAEESRNSYSILIDMSAYLVKLFSSIK